MTCTSVRVIVTFSLFIHQSSTMKNQEESPSNGRRGFLGKLASSLAFMGVLTGFEPLKATPRIPELPPGNDLKNADAWFNALEGKHRVVFDAPHPNQLFPFAWPRVFLLSNMATGATEADCGVVVVLRHDAICYAIDHAMWAKYQFGEVFKAPDPTAGKPAVRNPFQAPAEGEYKFPGFGAVKIGINELQQSGVKFCVCDAAMTVNSARLAAKNNIDAAALKQEWVDNLLPGIQPVPSGVWALGRAQEKGCAYIFAG